MRIDKHTLKMRYPSTWWHDLWREGLVSGNGNIGINIYGGVKEETTMITHHDLWHNGMEDILPNVSDAFKRQRKLMDEEKFKEASFEIVNALNEKGYKTTLESQLPICDLKMEIKPKKGFTNYQRAVHMDSGETETEWVDGGTSRFSKTFVSRNDDLIYKRLGSNAADLDIRITMDMHINEGSNAHETYASHVIKSKHVEYIEDYIIYSAKNDDGSLYGAIAKIMVNKGKIVTKENGIEVTNTDDILIVIHTFVKRSESILSSIQEKKENTELSDRNHILTEEKKVLDYKLEILKSSEGDKEGDRAREKVEDRKGDRAENFIEHGVQKNSFNIAKLYNKSLEVHKEEHSRWYHSAELSLNQSQKFHYNEELLLNAYDGKQSTELIEKLWRYGRYLFICGTSNKSNPFPLYGLWAGDYNLIWSHNMANENTQMTYWHSKVGNLLPFQEGLYNYYNNRIPIYRDNAKKLFDMDGIYMTAGTTPGVSTPNQVVPVIMNWVGAAGWIAQHYCDYYWYTRDEVYLRKVILPYLEEVAKFYEDFIEYYEDGSIHFYPSVSPENTPGNFMPPKHIQMAHPMPTTVNSTIDLAIVKELFTNLIAIGKEINEYQDSIKKWKKIISSIPEYKVNELGAIKEWQDDRFQERFDHRHISHIYPVFPGYEVNQIHNPNLLPSFKKAVELREIDAQTGWSLAHMAAIYARLEDGERAMEYLSNMAKSSLTNSFFSLHNDWRGMNISLCMDPAPVQLDAILGYVNAVQEMILYSSNDFIKLLPALSSELYKGKIKDFRYVGGYVSMSWDVKKQKFNATMKSIRDHEIKIQLPKYFAEYNFKKIGCEIEIVGEVYILKMKKGGKFNIKIDSMITNMIK